MGDAFSGFTETEEHFVFAEEISPETEGSYFPWFPEITCLEKRCHGDTSSKYATPFQVSHDNMRGGKEITSLYVFFNDRDHMQQRVISELTEIDIDDEDWYKKVKNILVSNIKIMIENQESFSRST